MRYFVRTGRRSAISMPLWLAALGYVFVGAAIAAAALAAAVIAAAVSLAVLLMALGAALVGRVRQRRALRK